MRQSCPEQVGNPACNSAACGADGFVWAWLLLIHAMAEAGLLALQSGFGAAMCLSTPSPTQRMTLHPGRGWPVTGVAKT